MADISILSRLINGLQRNIDVSQNSLIVGSLKVGTSSPTELTKAILDRLINLQNGSDVDATYHTHDGRYFTEAELSAAATGVTGSDRIGDDDTYNNFTPSATTVKGALEGIDQALANTADEKVGISASDTTPGYLAAKIVVDTGSNATNALEESIQSPGGDETLRIRFDQSKVDHGSIAGLGDDDHTIYTKADGTRAFSGNQSMGGNRLTNVADPTADQDAVTKAYLDARENGLKPKQSVRVAASTNINISNGLENGDTVDGIVLATGDRVLLMGQTAPAQNGIYVVVASGAASRSLDFDSLSPIDEINRSWVPVQSGSHAGKVFVQYGVVATLGTDAINFEFYDAIAGLVAGDMISKTGSTLSVDLLTNGGLKSSNPGNVGGQLQVSLEASNPSLEVNGSNELKAKLDAAGAIASGASGLAVQTDDSTIEKNANALRVKAAGITATQLAASVAGDGLSGGAGTALSVNVDGSTLEISSDALRVKDAGITAAKINSNVADQSTITGGAGSALAVQHSPLVQKDMIAGETMADDVTFLMRMAVSGETAGRIYKADKDASVSNKFFVIGLARKVGGAVAGNTVQMVMMGSHTLGANDTAFGAGDIGKPVYLTAAGAFSVTPPSAVDEAVYKIGVVETTTKIFVSGMQLHGIN